MLYRRKHIPSNLSRIYVQPVIENMESNQHNPRIWNPNFGTPKPGLTDSPESRGMTGHKQLRTGREKKSGINEWNTYRCKKQAGKGHLGRAIWSFSIAEQWRRMPDFRWQAQSRPIREAISQPWRPPWPCCNANQINSISSLASFLPSIHHWMLHGYTTPNRRQLRIWLWRLSLSHYKFRVMSGQSLLSAEGNFHARFSTLVANAIMTHVKILPNYRIIIMCWIKLHPTVP